jgi:formylglycine-generating enzyme required for sulfatase activity
MNRKRETALTEPDAAAMRQSRRWLLAVLPSLVIAGAALVIWISFGLQDARRRQEKAKQNSAVETLDQSTEPQPAPGPAPEGMVWIPGGVFLMGGEPSFTDAQPKHEVEVSGFWMDRTEVTNAQFARFADATGYVTVAERAPTAQQYPGAPPDSLVAGSIVFHPPDESVSFDNPLAWWQYVAGADWRHPEGPQSDIAGRGDHPVVHVCWLDAEAYAGSTGKRLPTEAEWEIAARGGLRGQRYVWGKELLPDGRWQANIWQGDFPAGNTSDDGFAGTAPVGSFPPNGFGLFDVAGNVWEWCADWYRPDYYATSAPRNPQGPSSSYDPMEPGIAKRVQRGGSYLCSDKYCVRYQVGSRGKGAVDSGATHVGFRCVKDRE